jgi:zinc transport system substrate-binding protein
MKNYLSAATAIGLILAALIPAQAADITAWRLFVSDHADGKVTVVDGIEGKVIDTLKIKGPASLYRSDSGAAVFAVQGAAGVVTAISTGVSFDDHGDHGDIEVNAPKLTGAEVTGEKPSHFVEHDGEFAAFFDGEGVARIFGENDALQGKLEIREVKADAPHHGVVIPFRDHDIVSVPNAKDPSESPIAAKIVGADGAQIGEIVECVGLHGEATSGNLAIIGGCEKGILVIRSDNGSPRIEPLAFAEGMPEGRVSTALGGRGMQYFLGNYGPDKVSLIDPTAGKDAFRLIDLPMRRVHFAVDQVRPKLAYVFTEDGQLHQIDVVKGAITSSLALTEPYSMDGHWSDPRPRVAVAGDKIVVTDPLKGKLHLVDAASFAKAGEIAVEGMPYNIVSVGGSGQAHETE